MADALTPMVRNILRVFRSATPEQLETGMNWYKDARGICEDFATAHGVTPEVAAGVFAALSPQNSYGANVNLARRFLASGGTLDSGYLGMGLAKARAIYEGADIRTTLLGSRGFKTLNFFVSINSAGQDGVCIDRHAYCIAVNEKVANIPSLSEKRYAAIALAYARASRYAGITAAEIQAVTWVVWRQRYWAEGAFDPRA